MDHPSMAPNHDEIAHEVSKLSTVPEGTEPELHVVSSLLPPDAVSRSDSSKDSTETPFPPEHEESSELHETDMDSELPELDWEQFENRFTEALQKLDEEESQILDQFDQLMEMFFIWAQTGSSHETDRTIKRLKTRERYVQLSEDKLEKKKTHYTKVVFAFKNALDLLRA
ncbi:hypothetical protein K3495_g4767 [Podosphaera aphanis]|nr:hypothetical protein K3495_g4767 [Podosphaera aphanis]